MFAPQPATGTGDYGDATWNLNGAHCSLLTLLDVRPRDTTTAARRDEGEICHSALELERFLSEEDIARAPECATRGDCSASELDQIAISLQLPIPAERS
jgi:hypothetical protein